MKENRMDTIFKVGIEEVKGALAHLRRDWGNVRAFRTKPIDPVDKLYTYEKLMLPEYQGAKQALIYKYGIEVWDEYEQQRLKQIESRGL